MCYHVVMSGFDPREYERTGGMYNADPEPRSVAVFGRELDPESRFARDLSAFCRVNTLLYQQAVANLATEVPDDFVAYSNSHISSRGHLIHEDALLPDALGDGYLRYLALKRIGYQIVAVSEEGDRDSNIIIKGQIALYRNVHESNPSASITYDDRSALPYFINNNTFDGSLERGHAVSWYESPMISGWVDTGMLERGFMTGTLLLAKEYLAGRSTVSLNEARARCIDIYEKLAAEDFAPLGPEELAGIAESSIRNFIEDNPEYTPLSQR